MPAKEKVHHIWVSQFLSCGLRDGTELKLSLVKKEQSLMLAEEMGIRSLLRFRQYFSFGVHSDRITEWSYFCLTPAQSHSELVWYWCPVTLFRLNSQTPGWLTAVRATFIFLTVHLTRSVHKSLFQTTLWGGELSLPNLHTKPPHLLQVR